MKVGVLHEILEHEYRVGLTPSAAAEYLKNGHSVMVETAAGEGSDHPDSEYEAAGCSVERDKKRIYDWAEMIVKVKQPLEEEYAFYHEGQTLFTYLHLAANRKLTEFLVETGISGVAYETVEESDGSLPLLRPMSQIAGRLSVQEGAKFLEKPSGGRGVLLGGVPGIRRGNVVVIGGGTVGINACRVAVGFEAEVTVLDISPQRLEFLEEIFGSAVTLLYSNQSNIAQSLTGADLVIGAVLIPGASAPKLIHRSDLRSMKPGSVLVDVAIDQGGCAETSRPTGHTRPTYVEDGVVHYCVANIPGAVPISSTHALVGVTGHYGLMIADRGIEEAAGSSRPVLSGVNTHRGKLVNQAVAESLDLPFETWKP